MPSPPFAWLSELTRRHVLLAVLIVFVALVAGIWSLLNVQDAVRSSRATLLSSLLTTQSEALKIWAFEKQSDTIQWTKEPSMVALAERLLTYYRSGKLSSAAYAQEEERFLRVISPAIDDLRLAAANIAAPDGTLIASLVPQYVGAKLEPDYFAKLKPALNGGSAFIGPTREEERLHGVAAERMDDAIVWTAAAIKDRKGKTLAVLCLGRPAMGRFARIFEATRPGMTGETYAFDEKGMLLSPSRFEAMLRKTGLLRTEDALSPGVLRLRVPAASDAPNMPLTASVETAIENGKLAKKDIGGTILEPYQNYLGTHVIGAWRWLPSLGLGIAIEMAETEALAPIRFVNANLAVLVMTLACALFLGPLLPPLLWRRFLPVHEGSRLGTYRLVRKLGEGGLAEVYEAVHDGLNKAVAIKVMKGQRREELERLFEEEARQLAVLSHPGIVAAFDTGRCDDGRPYYVMELVDGEPLPRLLHDGPMSKQAVCQLLSQVCDALQHAHDRGIVHGDVKPDNVLVRRDAEGRLRIKLVDLGFARTDANPIPLDISLLGTVGYMSPERILNPGDADVRGDVYSVGAIGYFLLTGKELIPDVGDLDHPHPVPAPPFTDDELASIIVKAMAVRKSERWSSCAEFKEALDSSLATLRLHSQNA